MIPNVQAPTRLHAYTLRILMAVVEPCMISHASLTHAPHMCPSHCLRCHCAAHEAVQGARAHAAVCAANFVLCIVVILQVIFQRVLLQRHEHARMLAPDELLCALLRQQVDPLHSRVDPKLCYSPTCAIYMPTFISWAQLLIFLTGHSNARTVKPQ